MPVLGVLIKQGLKLSLRVKRRHSTPIQKQRRELKKLLKKAKGTAFGMHYQFDDILSARSFAKSFREKVPLHNYNSMFAQWWHRCLAEEENVCWPGHIKYF